MFEAFRDPGARARAAIIAAGIWIAMNIIGNISLRLGLNAETADQLILVRWIDIVALLVDVPAALLLIVLVRRLTAIQQQAAASGRFAAA